MDKDIQRDDHISPVISVKVSKEFKVRLEEYCKRNKTYIKSVVMNCLESVIELDEEGDDILYYILCDKCNRPMHEKTQSLQESALDDIV